MPAASTFAVCLRKRWVSFLYVPSLHVGEGREGGARNDVSNLILAARLLRPSYATPLSKVVTTGLDPVVHANATRPSAGGSALPAKLLHGCPA
jgi:hypothetical protein